MITLIAAYAACILLMVWLLSRAPKREDLSSTNYESELADSLVQQGLSRVDAKHGDDAHDSRTISPTVPFDSSHFDSRDRNAG
ncbi:MAG: hypothetical protein AAFU85_13860 [Planctomycetota bacterium]